MNTLHSSLQDYLALRRGLGFKMSDAGRMLPGFVSFLEARQESYITAQSALEWAQRADVQPAEWARRLGFVRGFARYRSAVDPRTEVPVSQLLPHRSTRARPYLYSDEEVRRLLAAALQLPTDRSSSALRPWTYHCLLGLLTVTGLRISEALDLKLGDVDMQRAVLTIHAAKLGPIEVGAAAPDHVRRAGGVHAPASRLPRVARFELPVYLHQGHTAGRWAGASGVL